MNTADQTALAPGAPSVSPRLAEVLGRYVAIQEEMRALEREKKELRKELEDHLSGVEGEYWFPEIEGIRLRIRHKTETEIEYDEELLRERLGARFESILAPDPKKIRQHLALAAPLLAPVLSVVGSVDRDRVRAAIRQNLVSREEFSRAFTKKRRTRIAVMRVRNPGGQSGSGETGASPY